MHYNFFLQIKFIKIYISANPNNMDKKLTEIIVACN